MRNVRAGLGLAGLCAALLALGGCGETKGPRWHWQPNPAVQEKARPDGKRVGELIDALTQVSEEGVGFGTMSTWSGFIGGDEGLEMQALMFGGKGPRVSPAMRELVQMGAGAMPQLVEHVTDDRAVGLKTQSAGITDSMGGGFGGEELGDEYDPRYADDRRQPVNVNQEENGHNFSGFERFRKAGGHQLRVGDLCYVIIGQIVNRNLYARRYQPTAITVINSPVATPALAQAVRRDWGKLTAEEHKRSLMEDAWRVGGAALRYGDRSRAGGALRRLRCYYPEEVEGLALKLLARPLARIEGAFMKTLVALSKADNAGARKAIVERFRRENWKAAGELLPMALHAAYWESPSWTEDKAFAAGRERARLALKELYPGFNADRPSAVNATVMETQTEVVRGLGKFPSEKIDMAVARAFRAAEGLAGDSPDYRYDLDEMAKACMHRVGGKACDAHIRSYLERRVTEIEASNERSWRQRDADEIREMLKPTQKP